MSAVEAAAGTASRPAVYSAAAFSVLVWSITIIVTKQTVAEIDGLAVGTLRTLLPAAILAPVGLLLGLPRPRDRGQAGLLAVSSLGGFVLFPMFFSTGLMFTTAANAALILAATPSFTGLFAHIVERRRPSARWIFGILLALGGEALLIGASHGYEGGGSLLGDSLLLIACAAAAAGYIAGGKLSLSLGSWPVTCWGIVAAGLLLVPVSPWLIAGSDMQEASAAGWAGIAFLGLFSSLLAYIAWYWAIGRGGASRIGTWQFGQPLVALILAVLLLGEPFTLPMLLAGACILTGVALTQRG